ncbi:hypothetical protein [Amycolatopsis samaneae]|uniref:Uncharacterized protein n=1 Tax=Amycolatopsis samaneae TaxID=664691 RepID=A0ABW5GFI8_9PSEU
MRVKLLRSLGGHPANTVVDRDQAAAEWLLATGNAVAADDAEAETSAAPRARRSSRSATPGG